MKPRILVVLFLQYICGTNAKFVLPELKIEALRPTGLRVSMPVPEGEAVQLFGFHANINKPIRGKEQGEISRSATKPINGRWTLQDDRIKLEKDDVLFYWVFAQNNRLGFDREDQQFQIKEFTSASTADECVRSVTTINGNQATCANQVIFEDNFNTGELDVSLWNVQQYTPQYLAPDYHFVTYERKPENLFQRDGNLFIKPTVRPDTGESQYDIREGCTSSDQEACLIDPISASYKDLPVITSAQIKSKIAFKYGRVEIRCQLPIGDWIVPQLKLEPQHYEYGNGYASGQLWIAYVRGNRNLKQGNDDIGSNVWYSGPMLASTSKTDTMVRIPGSSPWGSNYHIFSMEWRPDGITYMLDGRVAGTTAIPPSGFKSMVKSQSYTNKWTSSNSPFDKNFVLTLGVAVAGQTDFPQNSVNQGVMLPWKNLDPRAAYAFKDAQATWSSTWDDTLSSLRVDSIKVYAI